MTAGRPTDWHIVGRDTDPTQGDPDSPAAGPLADAYASGRSPLADYDTGPVDLSGGWLTAWEKAGGDVREHPRNQLPYAPRRVRPVRASGSSSLRR